MRIVLKVSRPTKPLSLRAPRPRTAPWACAVLGIEMLKPGKHYFFLTNEFDLAAKTIADIYKERWQVELFFKWIKQNLKIKSFLGTSKNAVMTQIWIALITLSDHCLL